MSEVKASLYIGFFLGCLVTAIPAFYLFDANSREIGALEAQNSINAERLRTLEIYIQAYKEAHLTNIAK